MFLGVEQGMGKHENDVLIIIDPKKKSEANKWLAQICKTIIEHTEGFQFTISVLEYQLPQETKYHMKLK